jgi:predicted ArsR family transcriptional regulator
MTPTDRPDEAAADPAHDVAAQIAGIAALNEPVRRDLYRFVAAQPAPVSRDEAAAGVDVPRHVAKFHLDKLVQDGLLEVEFARPPGRSGPGAGRPAKLYRRSSRELAVSVPERHYDLAGRLLARAVTDAERDGVPVREALASAAHERGRAIGERARRRAGPRPSRNALLEATTEVLVDCGYEPRIDEEGVTLANCPFHALAQEHRDLVCGMNLDLMEGVAEGLGRAPFEPCLDPAPGRCCVRLRRPAAATAPRGGA